MILGWGISLLRYRYLWLEGKVLMLFMIIYHFDSHNHFFVIWWCHWFGEYIFSQTVFVLCFNQCNVNFKWDFNWNVKGTYNCTRYYFKWPWKLPYLDFEVFLDTVNIFALSKGNIKITYKTKVGFPSILREIRSPQLRPSGQFGSWQACRNTDSPSPETKFIKVIFDGRIWKA